MQIVILAASCAAVLTASIALIFIARANTGIAALRERLNTLSELQREQRQSLLNTVSQSSEFQDKRLASIAERIGQFSMQNETQLEQIRETTERRLSALQQENRSQMDAIRATVDEKLQKTLEERIGQSFALVGERLEQVQRGLGEMQRLAVGVGDLKKVLTNVKSAGTLGEFQLAAILSDVLTPEQYAENVAVNPESTNRVEFAVKLPGDGDTPVWLPVDSKFPTERYAVLQNAYESGDPERLRQTRAELSAALKKSARDISEKYIAPPYTTEFGVMFLPFEGLYAEALRMGLIEILQRDYRINIAGPTTMAALLSSLRMGFRTLSIQKRSGEVWRVLGEVKTEFNKFGDCLAATQKKLDSARAELDTLAGTRSNQLMRKLRSVEAAPEKVEGYLDE